jgi:hypothetical protein
MSKSKSGATRSGNRHTRQAPAKPAAVRHFEVLRKALAWILEECCLQSVVLHGNSTYQPLQLIQLAILWNVHGTYTGPPFVQHGCEVWCKSFILIGLRRF